MLVAFVARLEMNVVMSLPESVLMTTELETTVVVKSLGRGISG